MSSMLMSKLSYALKRIADNFGQALGLAIIIILVLPGAIFAEDKPLALSDTISRPKWAGASGTDAFGNWADVKIDGLATVQRFRFIQKGKFVMGSPESEAERRENQKQHPVTISKSFWLCESVCTQEVWKQVVGDNPSFFAGSLQLPVEGVSWDDVQKYISRLMDIVPSTKIRLPTEAEWEYACRSGTTGPFNGEHLDDLGWYDLNSDRSTHAVKLKVPNAWGLYDMHGNVWEFCSDWYSDISDVVVDPQGANVGQFRIIRGGSWDSQSRFCHSAYRNWIPPSRKAKNIGFRLCISE